MNHGLIGSMLSELFPRTSADKIVASSSLSLGIIKISDQCC
jgi:hypothetical protein